MLTGIGRGVTVFAEGVGVGAGGVGADWVEGSLFNIADCPIWKPSAGQRKILLQVGLVLVG